ncbi:hypothetical protein NUW58_g82 [Xylaria curta]|uniref:Uncharacterized protein n=1 Tax=Xylaria curta TaxID=42375 RepID=A0ACC1PRH0_9PEZI|nr:hypothetical protein NUW58_g82 [Xylaria curta]
MADDNGPRDDITSDSDDVSMPPALLHFFESWHQWYNFIIHRGEDIAPRRTPPYTQDFVTNIIRPVPFPLDISETWYCATLIAAIIVIHGSVDENLLFKKADPYIRWGGRVLGRVLVTVGAAVLSTLSFEIIGNILSQVFSKATMRIRDQVSAILVKRLHWGEVGQDGEPLRDEDNNFIWIQDTTYPREIIRETLQGLAILATDYSVTLFLAMGNQLVEPCVARIVGPVLYFFFSIPVDFVLKLPSRLSLPTPGLDKIRDPRTLWFEYGVPAVIQFGVIIFLWLLKILYMAKAERLAMQGWRVIDPQMTIVWHLIRATAMHLIAYTAYQLVCGIIVAMRSELPQRGWYITIVDSPIVPFLVRITPNGKIFAAALLFFFHWLLRVASVLGVRLARGLWMPYILWQTRYSRDGAWTYWPLFVESLADDMSVLDPTKRVTSRVAMTAIFGLRSSWPARFHLSNVVEDD